MMQSQHTRSTYLRTCFEKFPEISKLQWNKNTPFNFSAIEKEVEKNLGSKKTLSYDQLRYFTNEEHWWFDRWWVLPPKESVDRSFRGKKFNFHQLSRGNEGKDGEKEAIRSLLEAFKSIELVSIILRFIRPESYGIISPPTERVLDLRMGSDAVETYLNYLANLRKIRDQNYGLTRVADVDMALWVLHAKCFNESLKDELIKREYESDSFMLKLRAENIFLPLSSLELPRLADAIRGVREELAGLIGCWFFELEVRKLAGKKHVPLVDDKGEDLNLYRIIESLRKIGAIDELKKGRWHRLRKLRNRVIHHGKLLPSPDVDEIVGEALNLAKINKPS